MSAENGSALTRSQRGERSKAHRTAAEIAPDSLAPREVRTHRDRPTLSFSLELEEAHDDNILQLAQADLDRLAAAPRPPRFRVHTADDNITAVRTDSRWRLRPLRRRETRIAVGLDFNIYQRNDVKDWQRYGLSVEQELTASRRYLATIEIWRSLIPNYYLREITDADDSFGLPRRDRIRRSLQYRQTSTGVRYDQQLWRDRLLFAGSLERLHRNYDPKFDERDNDNDQGRIVVEVRPFGRWSASARLTYLAGTLDARGDLAASEIRDADISYRHHGLGVAMTLPWGRGRAHGRLDVAWMPETRSFTTTDKFDLNRFERINHRHEITVRVTQRAWGPLDVVADYDRLTSKASYPDGVVFDRNLTDFDQTRYGIMLRTRLDLLAR